VSRMLGMGDVLSLIEKAEQVVDKDEAAQLEQKLRTNSFTLGDFRSQLRMLKRMGPLESVLGMIPGLGNLKAAADQAPDEKQLSRVEAIVSSMTPAERDDHTLLNGSRRKRIARGSGTSVEDVNRLVKQFVEMRRVMQMLGQGGPGAMKKGMAAAMQGAPAGVPMRGGRKKKKGGPWGLIKSR